MRVRKAVPEGYQTPKAALFGDATPAGAPQRRRELPPFCALLRVGGWAAQDETPAAAADGRPAEEVHCEPAWFSSQESDGSAVVGRVAAAAAGAGAPRKRPHGGSDGGEGEGDWEEEEEEECCQEDRAAEVVMEGAGRRFARPRTRRRPGDALDESAATPRNSLDWEEAAFLEPWDAEMHGT